MNKFLVLIAIAAISVPHTTFAQDTTKASQLLSHYLALKDALFAGRLDQAISHAEGCKETATDINSNTVSEGNLSSLINDASKISSTKDLTKQREYLAGFSTIMMPLVKAVRLTDQPVYLGYSPMKKATHDSPVIKSLNIHITTVACSLVARSPKLLSSRI